MKKIETIKQWNILEAALKEKGWRLWQMQYRWDDIEGFHAWFWKTGKADVEVVTYNQDELITKRLEEVSYFFFVKIYAKTIDFVTLSLYT